MAEPAAIHGIVLADKPRGVTSAHVVAVAKRALGKPKVGHLGTLDPFASGLLPLCVGEGTKLAPYLNEADKRYEGVIRLGVTTDTLDRTGAVLSRTAAPDIASLDLVALARQFTGKVLQVPPAFSAIKRNGVPMYELARRGEAPVLPARPVEIHSLELTAREKDGIALRLHCSKGTYVRSLARDIGERLGCGAVLESLVRTGFAGFRVDAALSLDRLREGPVALLASSAVIAMAEALAHLPALRANASAVSALRAGMQRVLEDFAGPLETKGPARVLDEEGKLVAVIASRDGHWLIDRVFA